MRIIKSLIFILFFSLLYLTLLPSEASAGNSFYVDNEAPGANTGVSWQDAWKSFSNIAWNSIKPGDTLYISGGTISKTYNERMVIGASGNTGVPITITKGKDSGHNGKVIIDGKSGSFDNMINISGKNFVTVSNLEAIGAGSGGHGQIYVRDSTGVIVENCVATMEKAHGGIFTQGNQNLILRNNYISTPGTTRILAPGQTDGIYSQLDKNSLFEGNRLILRSTNESCHCDCIQMYKDESPTLVNNYCEHDDGKTIRNSQGYYATTGTGTMTAVGNISYSPTSLGYQLAYKLSPGTSLIAYHNTLIADNKDYNHTLYTDSSVSKTAKNNLILDTIETGSHFMNAVNRDFHLKSGSSAIGAGQNISLDALYSKDLDGVTRGANGKWDLGSYVFNSSGTLPTILLTPTGMISQPSSGQKPGDANGDGTVDGVDYVIWLNNYNKSAVGNSNGDFDGNGFVDGVDYVIWLNNYGK